MGDLGLADRLLKRFKDCLTGTADRIESALDREDLPELERLAHRLRGESANLGAAVLEDLAAQVEECAQSSGSAEALSTGRDLIRACRQFSNVVFDLSEMAAPPRT